MRGLKMASLALVAAATLMACEEGGKKEGFVGETYPHGKLDVTGSPYQARAVLDNRSGEGRDTDRMRGPSLVPQTAEQQQQPGGNAGAADAGTK